MFCNMDICKFYAVQTCAFSKHAFWSFLCSIHTKKRTSERDVMEGQNLAEMLLMAYYLKFWVQNFEILYWQKIDFLSIKNYKVLK